MKKIVTGAQTRLPGETNAQKRDRLIRESEERATRPLTFKQRANGQQKKQGPWASR